MIDFKTPFCILQLLSAQKFELPVKDHGMVTRLNTQLRLNSLVSLDMRCREKQRHHVKLTASGLILSQPARVRMIQHAKIFHHVTQLSH